MPTYVKKPPSITAVRWNGANLDEVASILADLPYLAPVKDGADLVIEHDIYGVRVKQGDWLVLDQDYARTYSDVAFWAAFDGPVS